MAIPNASHSTTTSRPPAPKPTCSAHPPQAATASSVATASATGFWRRPGRLMAKPSAKQTFFTTSTAFCIAPITAPPTPTTSKKCCPACRWSSAPQTFGRLARPGEPWPACTSTTSRCPPTHRCRSAAPSQDFLPSTKCASPPRTAKTPSSTTAPSPSATSRQWRTST